MSYYFSSNLLYTVARQYNTINAWTKPQTKPTTAPTYVVVKPGYQLCIMVINSAAYTKVDQAEVEKSQASEVNTGAVEIICQESLKTHCPLLHFSTDQVYNPNHNEKRPFYYTSHSWNRK